MTLDKKVIQQARKVPVYPRAWIGSRISYEAMARMVEIRKETKIPLTLLVGYACLKTFSEPE